MKDILNELDVVARGHMHDLVGIRQPVNHVSEGRALSTFFYSDYARSLLPNIVVFSEGIGVFVLTD